MIICEPLGGLNNRTKCLLSAMRVDEDIKLVWAYKDSDVHLWCKFSDIFDMPFEEFRTMGECTKKYGSLIPYSHVRFFAKDGEMDINHLDKKYSDNWTEQIPDDLKKSYLEVAAKLKPVKYIQDKIDEYKQMFDSNTITVAVRSWMDADKNVYCMGRYFEIERLFNILDDNDNKLFVTCDHQGTFDQILDRYKDRVIYVPKRTEFGDYKTIEGIQDSVIDLYLGGLNKLILSSMGSSFCEMQWWLGGGNAKIKVMNLHSNQDKFCI